MQTIARRHNDVDPVHAATLRKFKPKIHIGYGSEEAVLRNMEVSPVTGKTVAYYFAEGRCNLRGFPVRIVVRCEVGERGAYIAQTFEPVRLK